MYIYKGNFNNQHYHIWALQMTLDPSNKADAQATVCPQATTVLTNYVMPDIASFRTYAWYHPMLKELHHYVMPENAEMHHFMCLISHEPEGTHYCTCSIYHMPEEIHHRICPILTYARRTALLHALDILCARRDASLHVPDIGCARWNASLHMLDTACARYYNVPEEVHHRIVLDIACARRNASLHVLDIACARRNASSHCARDSIVPEVCISSRLHRARSLHAPESNQVTRVSTDVKNRYALFTHYLYSKGIIFQRHHLSWTADFMS